MRMPGASMLRMASARSHLPRAVALSVPRSGAGRLGAVRAYATPADPDPEEKKRKEFHESLERGIREAKEGKKTKKEDVPEELKQFFERNDRAQDSKDARASKQARASLELSLIHI